MAKVPDGGGSDSSEAELLPAPDEQPFPLLVLSAELRNEVYDKAIEDIEAILDPRAPGRLITASFLASVNHQVRDEFLSRLSKEAAITARVRDAEFGHVKRYLGGVTSSLSISAKLTFVDPGCLVPDLTQGDLKISEFDLPRDDDLAGRAAMEKAYKTLGNISDWASWLYSQDHLQTDYTIVPVKATARDPLIESSGLLAKISLCGGSPHSTEIRVKIEMEKIKIATRVYRRSIGAREDCCIVGPFGWYDSWEPEARFSLAKQAQVSYGFKKLVKKRGRDIAALLQSRFSASTSGMTE